METAHTIGIQAGKRVDPEAVYRDYDMKGPLDRQFIEALKTAYGQRILALAGSGTAE